MTSLSLNSITSQFSTTMSKNLKQLDSWTDRYISFIHFKLISKQDLHTQLKLADWSLAQFRLSRVLGVLALISLGLSVLLISQSPILSITSPIVIIISALLGWILPEIALMDAVKTKYVQISSQLPNFLTLFALLVSTGGTVHPKESFSLAIAAMDGRMGSQIDQLAKKSSWYSDTELFDEFHQLCGHPLSAQLCSTITLHSTYGSALETALSDLASRAHRYRLQQADKIAQMASGLLLGPLLFFHLPALLLIVLIPAIFVFTGQI